MNIGIVGAETHTGQLCNILNVERRIRGVRVTHVCGRTAALGRAAATPSTSASRWSTSPWSDGSFT